MCGVCGLPLIWLVEASIRVVGGWSEHACVWCVGRPLETCVVVLGEHPCACVACGNPHLCGRVCWASTHACGAWCGPSRVWVRVLGVHSCVCVAWIWVGGEAPHVCDLYPPFDELFAVLMCSMHSTNTTLRFASSPVTSSSSSSSSGSSSDIQAEFQEHPQLSNPSMLPSPPSSTDAKQPAPLNSSTNGVTPHSNVGMAAFDSRPSLLVCLACL